MAYGYCASTTQEGIKLPRMNIPPTDTTTILLEISYLSEKLEEHGRRDPGLEHHPRSKVNPSKVVPVSGFDVHILAEYCKQFVKGREAGDANETPMRLSLGGAIDLDRGIDSLLLLLPTSQSQAGRGHAKKAFLPTTVSFLISNHVVHVWARTSC